MGSLSIPGRLHSLYALLEKAKFMEDTPQIVALEREIFDLKRQRDNPPPISYYPRST